MPSLTVFANPPLKAQERDLLRNIVAAGSYARAETYFFPFSSVLLLLQGGYVTRSGSRDYTPTEKGKAYVAKYATKRNPANPGRKRPAIMRKGIAYFSTYEGAALVRDRLAAKYPDARIVSFQIGDAVQYYKSGPYYPETPRKGDPFNPRSNPSRRRRGITRRPMRRNPLDFGRPTQLSKRVYEVAYKHDDDGKDYKHDFGPGVCLELLSDGSIRIYSMSGKPLWRTN